LRSPAVPSPMAKNETERLLSPPMFYLLRSRRNPLRPGDRIHWRRPCRVRLGLSPLGRDLPRRHRHDYESQGFGRRHPAQDHGGDRGKTIEIGLNNRLATFLSPEKSCLTPSRRNTI